MREGIVYLAGGGCGDPGLITVRAKEKLENCDTVVYDALVNPEFLEYVPEDAERIYVGKRAKSHALPQPEINKLLVKLGSEGRNVVRLKGGDPYVFGRGGEEGEALHDAGVAFEVIPGITSVIGGLAYAGIPITHRDCVASFQVVTGHRQDDAEDLDWPVLAASKGTIVFLMGMKNLGRITQNLMANGMDPEKPAAVVYRASDPRQRVVTGTLETIEAIATQAKMTAPSLIVVGDVVTKREKLRFFDNKPFFGKRFVVTRSRAQASSTVAKIRELGGSALMYPTIKIEPVPNELEKLKKAIDNIGEYTHIIFTSVNGVEIFYETLRQVGRDSRALGGIYVTAIGDQTAKALETRGVIADFVPKNYIGESLIEGLRPVLTENDAILLPRSENARPVVADELSKICKLDEIKTYRTVREDACSFDLKSLLEAGQVDVVTFTSSTTVKYFVEKLGEENLGLLNGVMCASIGPMTSEMMRKSGIEVSVEAEVYTINGLLAAIEKCL